MIGRLGLLLLAGLPFALGGCAAGIAAKAVGMAVQEARGAPADNQHLAPNARRECTERASQYGTVHIIDVEPRPPSRMVVWGTVDDGKQRRSFECGFTTRITGFTLREIKPLK